MEFKYVIMSWSFNVIDPREVIESTKTPRTLNALLFPRTTP
jgi:hypothetical protein